MRKSYILPALSILSILFLLGLQVYWIAQFYKTTLQIFEREANMAFEDALKKEFEIRNDVIARRLTKKLLDTNYIEISSSMRDEDSVVVYKIKSVQDLKDAFSSSFSINHLNKPIDAQTIHLDEETAFSIKKEVVKSYVEMVKSEDLENHIIFYRSQYLGNFLDTLKKEEYFDTLKLRPVLDRYLTKKNIHIPYKFYSATTDSTSHNSILPETLKKEFPIITRALPSYSQQGYIRVLFRDPGSYVFSEMKMLIICSFVLVLVLGTCLYQLIKSLNREKKLSTIKNDFIGNITHEFKTPLATAGVAIEALGTEQIFENSEMRLKYLSHAKAQINQLNLLTDKILKISIYTHANQYKETKPVLIDSLIQKQIESKKLIHPEVEIVYKNASIATSLLIDETQMEHALSNILENAIKYGGENSKITIDVFTKAEYLIIKCADNGPGIAQEDLPFVFNKFYRGKHSQHIKGYGLGLSYVKHILKAHGGWVQASASKTGTTIEMGWKIQ